MVPRIFIKWEPWVQSKAYNLRQRPRQNITFKARQGEVRHETLQARPTLSITFRCFEPRLSSLVATLLSVAETCFVIEMQLNAS